MFLEWTMIKFTDAKHSANADTTVIQGLIYPPKMSDAGKEAPDVETAREMLRRVIDNFGSRAPRAMTILEEGFDDAVAVLNLPERYRKRLRTTNGVERLNEEVRRRERVIRIFPNVESAVRLLGALLMEKDEAWSTDRPYFDMRDYFERKRAQGVPPTRACQIAVAGSWTDATYRSPEGFLQKEKDLTPLDKYYIPTRYPNGLPGGLPSEAFSRGDAEMAIAMAEKVLDFVRKRISPEF